MRKRDLSFFRDLLESRKREMLDEAERALGSMNRKTQDGTADPTDRAMLERDLNLLLRICDRERKLPAKINAAFARIEKGGYGLCVQCGDEIGLTRLEARPVATLCIACKSTQEARERLGSAR